MAIEPYHRAEATLLVGFVSFHIYVGCFGYDDRAEPLAEGRPTSLLGLVYRQDLQHRNEPNVARLQGSEDRILVHDIP